MCLRRAKGLRSVCRLLRGTCERLLTMSPCQHRRASSFCRPRCGGLRYEVPQVLLPDLPPTHHTVQIFQIAWCLAVLALWLDSMIFKVFSSLNASMTSSVISVILWCRKMTVSLSMLLSQKCWECVQSLRGWGRVGWDVSFSEYGPFSENTISITSSL